jgi:hypothetical protein
MTFLFFKVKQGYNKHQYTVFLAIASKLHVRISCT